MKRFLVAIIALLSLNTSAQRFIAQSDNTTHFGANLQGLSNPDEIYAVKRLLGCKYMRDAVVLQTYNPGSIDQGVKRAFDSGMHLLLNVNWETPSSCTEKNFPKGTALTTFKSRLTSFIESNIQYLEDVVFVIENEPYNAQFYNYQSCQPFMSIVDYINELAAAVRICKQYNVKVTDGASHMTYYDEILNPPIPAGTAAARGDSGMSRYDTIQLSWYNFHFNVPSGMSSSNSAMRPNIIKNLSLDPGNVITGHLPTSNEWHQEDQGDTTAQKSLGTSIVASCRQGHIRHAIVFSGDGGSQAVPLVNINANPPTLNYLGRAYRDAIASNSSNAPITAPGYYISSSSGSDANSGTSSASPWKTLAKLNSTTLAAGDYVYLKAGDTFDGQIVISQSGTASNPITFTSYGSGEKPIINGFTTVSGWTSLGGGIYQTNAAISTSSVLNMLTFNSAIKPMGRYPNSGYLTYSSGTNGTLTSSSISGLPSFVGGEAVIRLNRFYIDRCVITNQTSTVVTYTPQSGTTPTAGFGFFFENNFNLLDQLGEWYYNPSTKKLSMFFGANNPTSYTIRAATVDTLIKASSRSNIVIDGLSLIGGNKAGVSFNGGSNCVVQNCDILKSGRDGIVLAATTNFTAASNTIDSSNSKGINAFQAQSGGMTITGNTINHTGLYAGMSWVRSNQGNMNGIEVSATAAGSRVSNNTVIGAGYIGIRVDMSNSTTIDSNYVDSTCLIKDDGGGIYTWNNNGSGAHTGFRIRKNVVLNSIGNTDGTNSTTPEGEGIYTDDQSNTGTISGNTIANCQRGIYNHSTSNFTINNNTVFNAAYGIRIQQDAGTSNGYSINNNIFFAKASTQVTAYFNNVTMPFGTLDNNYYCRPILETTDIRTTISGVTTNRTLAQWKTFSGQDANSNVTAITVSSTSNIRFEYNETSSNKSVNLGATVYTGVDGTTYTGTIVLAPFSSLILLL